MKTILSFGLSSMMLSYLFISMHNHTWDIMEYSEGSTFIFGLLSTMGFIAGCLVRVLGLDEPFKWNQ